ncbi:MAG: sugar isomerase [Planctomycetes bacterium GWF2_41_51]|nr:MAG: sugar isomerase [Planctomycetes bacterium GWF2_41_51]HBG27085.1 sugar isomerase [Phycisphaerales bacterium]
MNNDKKYSQFALVREMMETPDILRKFKLNGIDEVVNSIKQNGSLFFTGEGSSRIFPAKNAMYAARRAGSNLNLATDGGLQSCSYDLAAFTVFGASNSGQTKEVIRLFERLNTVNHKKLYALTANKNTKLETLAKQTFILKCEKEQAVAATKSVAEQALFYQALLAAIKGSSLEKKLPQLADAFNTALTMEIKPEITKAIAAAHTIYFAGKNDGVAEELTLKTNEITRKKSDFLEGTYAVHGIEEVMTANDVVILIDPFKSELEKIKQTLVDGVGLKVFAVSDEETIFPTIKIPDIGELSNYVYLAAGWNILVEVGVALNINLDKPQRARKVGNEFVG